MSDIDDNINITSKNTKQQEIPSIITKKMANLSIIIGIILFFILLGVVYKIYGVFGLCNGLFLLSFYVLILSFIFFTIGLQVENKVIQKNIDFLIDMFKRELPEMKPKKKLELPIEEKKELNKEDEKINRENDKIIYKTIGYFGSFVILLLIASIIIWKKTNNDFKIFKNFIVIKNLIVLVVVMIVQIIFYKLVIQNNRPIGIYDLIENLINRLKKKN